MATREYRFSKASGSYQNNSAVQSRMARRLFDFIPRHSCFNEVLEVGCGTGNLSELLITELKPLQLYLNDLSGGMLDCCRRRFSEYRGLNYCCGSILHSAFDCRFDLIIANAVFQWIDDKYLLFRKLSDLLKENGLLIYSDFLPDNFPEIRTVTGCSLNYTSNETELLVLKECGFKAQIRDVIISETFADPLALLRSFRNQGVSGLSGRMWSKGKLEDFIREYRRRFHCENGEGVYLTWHPRYVVASRV
ncbi:MAG: methyltransferase domain-containing protein [Succinivibrio sp.]|nr:methyltransferase domain-containing protein [Succinivibrio sp.]